MRDSSSAKSLLCVLSAVCVFFFVVCRFLEKACAWMERVGHFRVLKTQKRSEEEEERDRKSTFWRPHKRELLKERERGEEA